MTENKMTENNQQNYMERLNQLKALAEQKQAEKTRAEANLENLQNRKKEIETELDDMGVKPEDLEKEIAELQVSIKDGLDKAEQLLKGNAGDESNDESVDDVAEGSATEQAV